MQKLVEVDGMTAEHNVELPRSQVQIKSLLLKVLQVFFF